MTDYEQGFSDGERAAWDGRQDPLPRKPEITNERARGFWDARLPRGADWDNARQRRQFYREAA